MSVTKEFQDLLLKRSHYLYSFENGAIKDMLGPMQIALVQSKERLNDLVKYSTGYTLDWRIARLNDQIKEMEGILQAASYDSAGILQNKLFEVANAESSFIEKMLADRYNTIGVNIVGLPFAHIDYVVNNPLLAVDLQSKLSNASTSSLNSIKSQLTQSIVQGEDIAKATNRLIGPVGTAFLDPAYAPVKRVTGTTLAKMINDRAGMIVRSEILYVSNQVSREIFKQNKDVLKGVMWLNTLDNRTCLVCGTGGGTEYNYKEGTEDHGGPVFPIHPRCRCTYAPRTFSWAELEKKEKVDPNVSLKSKGAFINVAPNVLSYSDWLKTLDPDEAKAILGNTRYKLWNSGELKLKEMVKNNRILSVGELNELPLTTATKSGLYARADALSDSQMAKMTEKQIKAWEAYQADTKKTRIYGELEEKITAEKLGAEHVIGRKPFDMFLDKEFVEHKVLFAGNGEIRVKADQILSKKAYAKKYNGRIHTIVTDRRPGSPTYGKYYYRKGVGNYDIKNMMEVKDFDHMKELLLKGRKEEVLKQAIVKVPESKHIKMAEEYAKNKFGVKVVDYDGAPPEVGDLINKYLGGSIENLGVKPKGIFIDNSIFIGKSENAIAMAFENGNIYFNPKLFSSIEQIKADTSFLFKSGQFSTASEGQIVRHEAAHLKYFHLGGTEKTAAQKLTTAMKDDLQNGIGIENLPKYVSKYARQSQGEFYSEMTAKLLNGEKLHPVCTKIMKDIEKSLKVNNKVKIIENSKGL